MNIYRQQILIRIENILRFEKRQCFANNFFFFWKWKTRNFQGELQDIWEIYLLQAKICDPVLAFIDGLGNGWPSSP